MKLPQIYGAKFFTGHMQYYYPTNCVKALKENTITAIYSFYFNRPVCFGDHSSWVFLVFRFCR